MQHSRVGLEKCSREGVAESSCFKSFQLALSECKDLAALCGCRTLNVCLFVLANAP